MPKYKSGEQWSRYPGSTNRAPSRRPKDQELLMLVRRQNVRRYCNLSADVNIAKEVFERLDRMVVDILDRGVDRCLFRKRKTLQAVDL